jgi:preprotein translocase subunit SecG
LSGILSIVQLILAIFLIILILLQAKGSGFSGAAGGDNKSIFSTRRGLELRLFQFTIVFATIFILLSLVNSLVPVR